MSWKGFQKSFNRTPQTLKQRFSIGDNTNDHIYHDAERRFQELEKETVKLHEEAKRYFDAINSMLDHQIAFSKAVEEIYMPISGQISDPESFIDEGHAAGLRACEEYETVVRELKETLKPELETINTRVIRPATELLEVIKVVQKTSQKRSHKQLDYDRHRTALKKLQDKTEKSLKDEKALYKAENDMELATQEFNYFNSLLKEELPILFELESNFIKPLFQSFYYMQLNVFYTLYEKMQNMDISYFDLSLDIEAAFEKKHAGVRERAEALEITHFKTTGGVRRPGMQKYNSPQDAMPPVTATAQPLITNGSENKPPPYSPASKVSQYSTPYSPPTGVGRMSSANSSISAVAKAKGAPPPAPKPKPNRFTAPPAAETVMALYDYDAQAEGDLSFVAGDVIEIVRRTANENEWWTGRLKGRQGQFPGNYVQLNSS